MSQPYQHTQFGRGALAVPGLLLLGMLGVVAPRGFQWPPIIIAITLAVIVFLFPSLTVTVRDGSLQYYFGAGLIGSRVPLELIHDTEVRKMPFCGWGIRYTGLGTYWTIAGRQALLIRMSNGIKVLVGTDEPEQLQAAVKRAQLQAARSAASSPPGSSSG